MSQSCTSGIVWKPLTVLSLQSSILQQIKVKFPICLGKNQFPGSRISCQSGFENICLFEVEVNREKLSKVSDRGFDAYKFDVFELQVRMLTF